MNNLFLKKITLSIYLFVAIVTVKAQTGETYSFDNNPQGWWSSATTHVVSHESGNLKVVVDRPVDAWNFIGRSNLGSIDISSEPRVSMKVKATADVDIYVALKDADGGFNRNFHLYNGNKVIKSLTGDEQYHELIFDFSAIVGSDGVDYTKITQIHLFFNHLQHESYNGTLYFDEIKMGTDANTQSLPTGYAYTFDTNHEGWWSSGGSPTHTIGHENEALKVEIDKDNTSWDFIGVNNFGTLDLSDNPLVSFDIKATADISKLYVVLVDVDGNDNRDQLFWGSTQLSKNLTGDGSMYSLVYDFSIAQNADDNTVNYSAINQVRMFFNMGGEAYTGTVHIDNFMLGSEVSLAPDKSQLIDAISSAQDKHDAAVEGTDEGQYEPGSKATFQTAIDAAQAVVDDENATQEQINQAISDLATAEEQFDEARVVSYFKVEYTQTPPLIDGEKDDVWDNANNADITHIVLGGSKHDGDISGQFSALWANDTLFVLVDVQEDTLFLSKQWAKGDFMDVYLDVNNEKGTSYGTNDYFWVFRPADTIAVAGRNGADWGPLPEIPWAYNLVNDQNSSQYLFELAFPLTELGLNDELENGTRIGFDIKISDDDSTGIITQLNWSENGKNSWDNPSHMSTIELSGKPLVLETEDLETLIESAQTKHDNAVEGNENGNYATGSKAVLFSAIQTATQVLENAETQEEIDDATEELALAIAEFEATKVIATRINNLSSELKIYPNPASDYLFIEAENMYFAAQIVDISGRKIFMEEVNTHNPMRIDVANLKQGVYFIKIKWDNGEHLIKKIIKR